MIFQLMECFLVGARMGNNKAFTLANGGKASFFDCHRRFLPLHHRYRKNRKDFFVGRVEKDVSSPRLSGEELHDVCRTLAAERGVAVTLD